MLGIFMPLRTITKANAFDVTYGAWNRMAKVDDGASAVAEYEYDGQNRRIVKDIYVSGSSDHVLDFYYNENWQVLEVRKDGDTDPLKQYIWHPYYIDALLLRYHDSDTDGSGIDTHYYAHDANMNVTAVFNSSGTVVERYEYDSYGQPLVLDADFSNDGDNASDIDNEILFAGYRYDAESGLYHVRNRMYHPTMGRWLHRDRLEYHDGSNLYEYVGSNSSIFTDPFGLRKVSKRPDAESWTFWTPVGAKCECGGEPVIVQTNFSLGVSWYFSVGYSVGIYVTCDLSDKFGSGSQTVKGKLVITERWSQHQEDLFLSGEYVETTTRWKVGYEKTAESVVTESNLTCCFDTKEEWDKARKDTKSPCCDKRFKVNGPSTGNGKSTGDPVDDPRYR